MPAAFIISTGSELMNGSKKDSNADFLAARMSDLGFAIRGRMVVGDDGSALEKSFLTGLEMAQVLVSTGGLGPTFDDLTREAACRAAGVGLEYNSRAAEEIEAFFHSLGREMPESNRRQAYFPVGAEILPNHAGTAAGTFLQHAGKTVVLLPGPPREMCIMFEKEVLPRLLRVYGPDLKPPSRRLVKIFGLGESLVEARVKDLLQPVEGLEFAILAQDTEVMIKMQTREAEMIGLLDRLQSQIAARMPGYVYSFREEQGLAARVIDLLREREQSLALAESCTGGLIARMITDEPGSSDVFWGGAVTYSNEAKMRFLGVDGQVLQNQGAVSEPVAAQMAEGVRRVSGADWGLSVTGIAGPGGGSEAKPVGLTYIACSGPGEQQVKRFQFRGDRDRVRNLAARSALSMLMRHLLAGGGE